MHYMYTIIRYFAYAILLLCRFLSHNHTGPIQYSKLYWTTGLHFVENWVVQSNLSKTSASILKPKYKSLYHILYLLSVFSVDKKNLVLPRSCCFNKFYQYRLQNATLLECACNRNCKAS